MVPLTSVILEIPSRPADVHPLHDAAVSTGATPPEPAARSLRGHGGVVRAPADGVA